MTRNSIDAAVLRELCAAHGDLVGKMFLEGLTTPERRRLARVRSAIDRMQYRPRQRWRYIETMRSGRARRIASRKIRASIAALVRGST